MNVPNLDDMDLDELQAFQKRHVNGARAKELGVTREVAGYLASYAWNKIRARWARASGNIPAALLREQVCDQFYRLLPKEARW